MALPPPGMDAVWLPGAGEPRDNLFILRYGSAD
jgi:hypothetical protein